MAALGAVVAHVDEIDNVVPLLEQLGRDHRRFSVITEHYAAVGASLLATLQHFLGRLWMPDLADTWAQAYGVVEFDQTGPPPEDADLILDGTDNFPTRYLVNDASVLTGKPNVYGSIFRFDGQTTVFAPHLGGPCYRCLFPEPPPAGAVPSCAEAGVLGVLPGIVGTMQATEALKLILGIGEPLIGRLVHFDALKMKFREFNLKRDPDCPVCGEQPTITRPIDYETFCHGVPDLTTAARSRSSASDPSSLNGVGTPSRFPSATTSQVALTLARIEGANLIPLGELPARWQELDREKEIFVFCHSGVRSARAAEFR